MLNIFSWQ